MLMAANVVFLMIFLSLLVAFGLYHITGSFLVINGVSPLDSAKLAVIETVVVVSSVFVQIAPYGDKVSLAIWILLPFVMTPLTRQVYDTNLLNAILIVLIAVFFEIVLRIAVGHVSWM